MNNSINIAKQVIQTQAQALQQLGEQLTSDFEKAVEYLLQCKGHIVVCGIGKSGLVGKKIAATLASTGSPSFFLHPSEAIHGDLGMLREQDCFLSISNSGETDEILQVLPYVKRLGIPHICLVGQVNSTLARNAQAILHVGISKEASPIAAVPMASTTAAMVMGDALATVLLTNKQFDEQNFAQLHPGGSLGRKLVTTVSKEMTQHELPIAGMATDVKTVIWEMSKSRFGLVVIVGAQQQILGVITDGDLRRSLQKHPSASFFDLKAKDLMTTEPKTVSPDALLWEADQLLLEHKITSLLVEQEGCLLGIIAKHQIK
jgi:arabinose-5-phosphate isomerase